SKLFWHVRLTWYLPGRCATRILPQRSRKPVASSIGSPMQRDARARLWHARSAAREVQRYLAGKSRADYDADAVLRSAVERQMITVGEALSHLRTLDPETAARIPYLAQVVG